MNWKRLSIAVCFVVGAAVGGTVHGAEKSVGAGIIRAPAFSAKELSAQPVDSWITNGGNLFNQRYTPLAQINRENVAGLRANWRTHLKGSGMSPQHSGQAQPLVYRGVMYVVTGANDVFALAVDTGEILWSYEAKLDPARVKVCCGWVNRGVALGDGKVFVGQLDAKLIALDQRTGQVVWTIQAEDPLKGYSFVSAPLYYDGMIITGFGGGDMGVRGRVKAYDARNGKLKWTFYTIPGPGEPGHETWPGGTNESWKYGGAAVWQTPAVDPQLGLVYFSTSNAAPDLNGSTRKGDNLFTVSILALDVKTGAYRWHFQQVHHDIWDYDSPNPVVLFDAPYEGIVRRGLAEVSKTGWVYILDRETGRPLLGIEERPVPQEPRQHTAATQPHVIGDSVVPQSIDIAPEGFELVNGGRIFTPFWDKPVLYKPSMAVNWPPSSYDPESYRLYVCASDTVGVAQSDLKDFTPPTFQRMYMGGSPGAAPGTPRLGTFSAVDLRTNRLVWQQQWGEPCFSGSLATKGGLIFVGRSDGRFTALDNRTGRRLWQFQTDAGVNANASTFEFKGKQYLAVLSAGTLFAGSAKGDSVWLFSLDGKIESLPAAVGRPTASAAPSSGPRPPQEVQIVEGIPNRENGSTVYRQFCVACHGDEGRGGHGGGATLDGAAKDIQSILTVASTGQRSMPAFRGILTPAQLRDVASFIAQDLFGNRP